MKALTTYRMIAWSMVILQPLSSWLETRLSFYTAQADLCFAIVCACIFAIAALKARALVNADKQQSVADAIRHSSAYLHAELDKRKRS